MQRPTHRVSRRAFVRETLAVLTASGPIGTALGITACTRNAAAPTAVWAHPALLDVLGAERTEAIGNAWISTHPHERSAESLLVAIAHHDTSGGEVTPSSISTTVAQDFEHGRIVIVDRWMLSVTEARQCALYALGRV